MNAQKAVTGVVCLAAIAVIALAIMGGVINFSRVPFWDMWNGSLQAVQRFDENPLSAIFYRHNEHKIVFSNVLFLAEYKLFDGSNHFLIVMNYVCVALACVVLCFSLYLRNRDQASNAQIALIALPVSAWLFLWTQHENLTWAFQSQFFLAQLVPLIAFLLFGASVKHPSFRKPWFWLAICAGFASCGTMANGLAALPLMTVGAIAVRMGFLRVGILGAVSTIAVTLYMHDYNTPSHHVSFSDSLLHHPIDVLVFTLRYMGSPFMFILGPSSIASKVAVGAGAFFAIAAVTLGVLLLLGRRFHFIAVGLLLFVAYIGATAFLTSAGRIFLGPEAAFSSRYTTPALMGWAALFCIFSPAILGAIRQSGSERFAYLSMLAAATLIILKYQFTALTPADQVIYNRAVAALALELNLPDQTYTATVYPDIDRLLGITRWATEADIAVFGLQPFKDLRGRMGEAADYEALPVCPGNLDNVEAIPDRQDFVRIHGWLFGANTGTPSDGVSLIDEEGRLVGFALSGGARPDVAELIDDEAATSGFTGYLLSSATNRPIVATDGSCQASGSFERNIYRLTGGTLTRDDVSVSTADITTSAGWDGSDFDRSQLEGLQVLGSVITSDADTGSVRFMAGPGDTFLYRSGPTSGRQILTIVDAGKQVQLPVVSDWTLIELTPEISGGEAVEIEISDAGDGWGEWSAIAIRPSENPSGQE